MKSPDPAAALRECLARHLPSGPVGVAVSGGGDSTALLVLAAEAGLAVSAVSVDHGLRAEAAAELGAVAGLCAQLGVPHAILNWRHDGRGNLQAAARAGRRALIGEWARAAGLHAVLLGHTLEDQAETVLMRLARGSGVDGLGAMEEVLRAEGVLWLRPLLPVPREALRELLRARGIGWSEDRSNTEPRFARVRARKALAALQPLGLDAAGLAATAARMRRARAALELQTSEALARHARDDRGTVLLAPAVFDLAPEVRDRLFVHCLRGLTGAAYPTRLAALHRFIEAARAGKGAALGGCLLRVAPEGLRLFREARAVAGLAVPAGAEWDGRWRAEPLAGQGGEGIEMRALGEGGLALLSRGAAAGRHSHWRESGLPRAALAAQPGLWRGDALVAAPEAGWPNGWQLHVRPVAARPVRESESH
ncbi:MAG: tRNA lysidine(34) synthetase TilS [Pararhodobacter sp.]|nr:tRNA lysidine(34) synthetase TilS [Pararhodobacter sp.]